MPRPRRAPRITILTVPEEAEARAEAAEQARAEAQRNPKKLRRAPQPGRRPPTRPVREAVEDRDLDSDLSVSEGGSDADEEQRRCHRQWSAAQSGERVKRNHMAFAARRPGDSERMLRAAPRRTAKLEREHAAFDAELQQRGVTAVLDHPCFAGRDDAEIEQLCELIASERVTVVTLHTEATAMVPTLKCRFCSKQWTQSACDLHCFPCQSVMETVWVDDAVLLHTASLLMDSSCSMTAAHAALSYLRTAQRGEPAVMPITVK